MQIALPELDTPVTLRLGRTAQLSDDDYFAFCAANPDLRLERTSRGEIVIVPPAGMESDFRCSKVLSRLVWWAERTGRGKAFGCSVEVFLPDGSALSPDAAWVSNERLASVSHTELRRFPHLVPEFIAEVMSPSDRLPAAKRKMAMWMANGVELAWLLDGDKKCVHVYRQGCETRMLVGPDSIAGEGPLEGFVLDLPSIWAGL